MIRNITLSGNFVVIDAVEEERQRFEEDKRGHDPVNPENLLRSSLLEDEDPETSGQEEQDCQHLIQRRERHFSSREITICVLLLYFNPEGDRFLLD